MRVAVTLCTRARPEVFRACLSSLIEQDLPPDTDFALIVVENDDHPHSRAMVEELAKAHASPRITYLHEPRIGIPFARNRALAQALTHDPDWIGFIDDDEVADSNWIANFIKAAQAVPCDVLQGPVECRYPESTPKWMPLPGRKHLPTGRLLRTAATSNTFMRAHIARTDGLGLRFNESMRFTGGSDTEFFFRASDLGARICWMNDALIYETVPECRTTLRWQQERSLRVAANSVFIQRNRLGLVGTIAKSGPKYASRLVWGALAAPVAAAVSLIAAQTGRRMMCSALRSWSSGLGGLRGFLEVYPEPYKMVDNQ